MTKEALKQRLGMAQPNRGSVGFQEALAQPEHGWTPERIAGMARLKEAQDKKLAQPEQDGKCKYCTDGCPACDARKLPEQERFLVATIGNWGRVEWADGVFPSLGEKMYSAPRTWVGLTDEEIDDLSRTMVKGNKSVNWLCQAIEAKLKEKNT